MPPKAKSSIYSSIKTLRGRQYLLPHCGQKIKWDIVLNCACYIKPKIRVNFIDFKLIVWQGISCHKQTVTYVLKISPSFHLIKIIPSSTYHEQNFVWNKWDCNNTDIALWFRNDRSYHQSVSNLVSNSRKIVKYPNMCSRYTRLPHALPQRPSWQICASSLSLIDVCPSPSADIVVVSTGICEITCLWRWREIFSTWCPYS